MTKPRRALIIVDVQNDYFDNEGPLAIQYPPRKDSLARIVSTLATAQHAGIPVAVVQHEYPEGAPVFAAGSQGWQVHPDVEAAAGSTVKRITKSYASVFAGTGLTDWVRTHEVDTITLVGYMTNNCVLASAAEAETHGLAAEVLSDATGAINIANEAGFADAKTIHTTLMALLNSNFAAVADTATWSAAAAAGRPLPKPDLGASAVTGAQRAGQA